MKLRQSWSAYPSCLLQDSCTPELLLEREIRERWPQKADLILLGVVRLRFTEAQDQAALGPPDDVNRDVGPWGTHAQYVYEHGPQSVSYYYFEDGVLTSWQDY